MPRQMITLTNFQEIEKSLIDLEKMTFSLEENREFKLFKDIRINNLYYGFNKYTYDNGKVKGDNSRPICYIYTKDDKYYLSGFKNWTVTRARRTIKEFINTFNEVATNE